MNFENVYELLQEVLESKVGTIKDLVKAAEEKEKEINKITEALTVLESSIIQIMEDRAHLIDEYEQLINSLKQKKATACMSSGINKTFIKSDEVDETIEKAKRIIEKEEAMIFSYELSNKLNRLRSAARKGNVTEVEFKKDLEELEKQIDTECSRLDEN